MDFEGILKEKLGELEGVDVAGIAQALSAGYESEVSGLVNKKNELLAKVAKDKDVKAQVNDLQGQLNSILESLGATNYDELNEKMMEIQKAQGQTEEQIKLRQELNRHKLSAEEFSKNLEEKTAALNEAQKQIERFVVDRDVEDILSSEYGLKGLVKSGVARELIRKAGFSVVEENGELVARSRDAGLSPKDWLDNYAKTQEGKETLPARAFSSLGASGSGKVAAGKYVGKSKKDLTTVELMELKKNDPAVYNSLK